MIKNFSFFGYIIAGFFFLAAFNSFETKAYEQMFLYIVIGAAFILIRIFKAKHNNSDSE